MRERIITLCRFCKKEITDNEIWPADCDCDGAKTAKAKWLEEFRSDPDYEPPLSAEEHAAKYPQVYHEKRLVDKDDERYVAVDVRRYDDGYGFSIYHPFINEETGEPGDSGLCFDLAEEDIGDLMDLLDAAMTAIKNHKKKGE